MQELDWESLKKFAIDLAEQRHLNGELIDRLKYEIKEIEKQGANTYWITQYNEQIKYETNKNGLVLPWLLGLTPVDPLLVKHTIVKSTDMPDADIDCMPKARDSIKAFAAATYGDEYVCSVGTWQTFKFKSALQDAARGLGFDVKEVMVLTKALPDDVDELKDGGYSKCTKCSEKHAGVKCPKCGNEDTEFITIGKLLAEYDVLAAYEAKNKEVVDKAVRMVGKIKTMGKHAGGIIITNTKLLGNVPMGISKGLDGSTQWTSMWTEGRNTQLSKLGYVKWDLLGLKTLQYIHEACQLIGKTRGVKFNTPPWRDNDPEINSVGWYLDAAGKRCNVPMDDPEVFKMLNALRTETVFQFETDIQRSVLSNGVRDYYDLQVFNAMGHPGPIAFIPEYVERRDDVKKTWVKKEHPEIAKALMDTHGIICYQEDSRVSFADGREIPIKNVVAGDMIHSLNLNNRQIETHQVVNCGKTVFGDGLEVVLDNGYKLIITPQHKLLTYDGMVAANQLTKSHLVAAALNLPSITVGIFNCDYEWLGSSEAVAYLIGQLIGDGQLTGTSTSLCVGDEASAIELQNWITKNIPKIHVNKYFNTRAWYLGLSCSERVGRYSRFRELTISLDIRKSCYHKRIPQQIMVGNKVVKAAFLAGLLDSDGCLATSKHGHQIAYISTVNAQLREDIRRLCAGFGIITKIYNKHNRIYIYDTKKLSNICGRFLVVKGFDSKLVTSGNNISYLPKELLDQHRGEISIRAYCKATGLNRLNYRLLKPFIRYGTATKCGIDLNDIRYYKIKSITPVYNQQFYNLTVEPYHNLVVNGIIGSNCYQEQLQMLWQKFAGFTAPEAEAARKAVAKKWVEKLKPIEQQWLKGASKTLGQEWAETLWKRQVSFGHYAFNRSHSCAYILVAYWCAFLKVHFAPEWWAAVMSGCHSDRVPKYMNTARREGVKFGPIDIENIHSEFSVDANLEVMPGLTSVRGIGDKASAKLIGCHKYADVDAFVLANGKAKTVMEPMIKLGAFQRYHNNIKATWMWYLYKYCSGKEITQLKAVIRAKLTIAWTPDKIKAECERRTADFRKFNPKKKIPSAVSNWKPPINDTRENVMALYSDDFTLNERLKFEKHYLGYYWHSPLDLYETSGATIASVKEALGGFGKLEVVVEKLVESKTKNDKSMGRLHITDGLSNCTIVLWHDQLEVLRPYLKEGWGIQVEVKYDKERDSFTLAKSGMGVKLPKPLIVKQQFRKQDAE